MMKRNRIWRKFSQLVIVVSLSSYSMAQEIKTQIYTEQGFLSVENSVLSSMRLRSGLPLNLAITPFIQMGSELTTIGNLNHQLDEGASYFYFGPGVFWLKSGLMALLEWRVKAFYQSKTEHEAEELRATLLFNRQWLSELSKKWMVYREVYAEGFVATVDNQNAIVSGWGRFGLRNQIWPSWNVDTYLEPYGSIDSGGRFYNRKVEIRPTLRIQYWLKNIGIGLSGAVVYPVLGKIQNHSALVDRSLGLRVLAVIGGEL